jgi:hypothetical protein
MISSNAECRSRRVKGFLRGISEYSGTELKNELFGRKKNSIYIFKN